MSLNGDAEDSSSTDEAFAQGYEGPGADHERPFPSPPVASRSGSLLYDFGGPNVGVAGLTPVMDRAQSGRSAHAQLEMDSGGL